jgi:UMF1 family MFS transporter
MNQQQLILFMILVQATSVIGAYIFAIVGGKIGFKRSLVISILLMTAIVIWMIFNQTLTGFFVIGALAGFALTGVQSVSRTMVGLFAPNKQSAEFFGFFAVAGRTSSFIGPTVYGWLAAAAAVWFQGRGQAAGLAEQAGQRVGIVSIAVFLLVGLGLLLSVNEKRARQVALDHNGVD